MKEDITPYIRFLKSIQKPDLEGVWLDGQDCAENQVGLEANPYPKDSTEYFYWSEGWWAGFYEESTLSLSATNESKAAVTQLRASNDPVFSGKEAIREWVENFTMVLGTLMSGMLCYELADIAV